MRLIGLLFIFAAIGIGALWPWVQISFLGRELQELTFDKPRTRMSEPAVIRLSQDDNPVRVRFSATYMNDAKNPPVKVPIKVVVTDRDGVFLNGIISFPTHGTSNGPGARHTRAGTPLEFNVLNSGDHEFRISLAPNANDGGIVTPGIRSVRATVIANAPELDDNYKALAAILALAGFYILIRSRRSNPRTIGKSDPPDRWGRG